jgi:hypothetical protein
MNKFTSGMVTIIGSGFIGYAMGTPGDQLIACFIGGFLVGFGFVHMVLNTK